MDTLINTNLNRNYNPSFNRALTTREKQVYLKCVSDAKKMLKIKDTSAIVFDYLIPSELGKNIGIGTSFSENAQKFVNFLKEFAGITSIQLNPQGILKDNTVSPYSATSLSIGEHIIDLFKLCEKRFGKLLKIEEIKEFLITENADEFYRVDYKRLLRQDYKKDKEDFVFSKLLNRAYSRFKCLDENSPLKKQFNKFCKQNDYRLEKESLYYALSEVNGSTQWQCWGDNQNLFATENNNEIVEKLKNELRDKINYHKFVQFIADKQQKISKKQFNKNGIKIYGDIPISFSPSEQWGNKSIFSRGYSFGFYYNGDYHDWGSPAPDMDKMNDKIKELFNNRLRANLERYDGVRIDAAWEMVNPCLIHWTPNETTGRIVDNIDDMLIKEMEKTAKKIKKTSYSPTMFFLELIGDEDIIKTVNYTKNKFLHTLVTGNVADNMGSIKNYEANGYKDGRYMAGIGTHDNSSLIELSEKVNSENEADREFFEIDINELSKNMNIPKHKLREPKVFRLYKLAEIFATQRQFINIFDIFGVNKYINKWDSSTNDYWVDRLPINYEKLYFQNLIREKGLNLPETLLKALELKITSTSPKLEILKSKLQKFAEILKEDGPLTEQDANKLKL